MPSRNRTIRPSASCLRYIRKTTPPTPEIRIGALTRHAELLTSELLQEHLPIFADAEEVIADPVVRNRGTIGGSLSHADPAADWVSALPALGAKIRLRSASGVRDLAIEDFVTGALESALQPGEIVEAIRVPLMRPSARWGYFKVCRKPGELSTNRAT